MRKVIFLLNLMILAFQAFAQKGKPVQLTSSEVVKGFSKEGVMRVISPVFSQEGSTLSADSADFNQNANTFDAFGNVVITQPGGTIIYADQLNYNGTTRLALLTNNVRLIDKEAVLTTNFLTYNLGTRIGTYTGGGQIVNGTDILTSKNGYYFANTRDAYFRYDVLVNTPDALITTDTLKYNSGTRVANFYGPTNIKGKKDKTNLYTENGRYNTLTDQAWFGKKNLYTDGSKFLKGDSLYYDGKAGFGKAINHVNFTDTTQKISLFGNQGIYRKIDESAVVTRNAYVVMQTKPDSGQVDSIWMTADTLRTKLIFLRDLKPANQEELKSNEELEADSLAGEMPGAEAIAGGPAVDSLRSTAAVSALQDSVKTTPALQEPLKKKKDKADSPPRKKKGFALFRKKRKKEEQKAVPVETQKEPLTTTVTAGAAAQDSLRSDTLAGSRKAQSKMPLDTTRTRIVLAYNRVKIFKSDLQSKSDSVFYSYADSIIRCYKDPMIWTQGSQLSADTIFLQLKNQKLDNMLLQNNGFVANTELDSSKFNQVRGKVLTGLFDNNKLSRMFVDGNAESIYYTVQDSLYSGMNRALSSRMRLEFQDNKLREVILIRKPEGTYYPIEKVDKEAEILKGFIWKPKERPKSKEEIIPSLPGGKAAKAVQQRKVTPAAAKPAAVKKKKG